MTIPYMHNCSHQDEGWCLACVRKQGEELLQEVQALFELRWKADMRAIKQWQVAHPERGNVWPDHADMVVWLLEKNNALVQFAKDYLVWRNSPDGPEVITGLGAHLTGRAEKLVN